MKLNKENNPLSQWEVSNSTLLKEYVRESLHQCFVAKGISFTISYHGHRMSFEIIDVEDTYAKINTVGASGDFSAYGEPLTFFQVGDRTKISLAGPDDTVRNENPLIGSQLNDGNVVESSSSNANISSQAAAPLVGGLHKEMAIVHKTALLALHKVHLFNSVGMSPPRGLLLHGPPGRLFLFTRVVRIFLHFLAC